MTNLGIKDFLIKHAGLVPVSFHMPGHKGSRIYKELGYGEFLSNMMDCDITEITGADNLFQAEGIIRNAMSKYRELYNVKESYLLVNGTSGGIIASILAAVKPGRKLIMARNCHKSVFNALSMGGITPVYAYPVMEEEYGISGQVEPEEIEQLLKENPDADAVILPSPNYYGICSDIRSIAETVHRHGKVLIVDQAHGAHLKFMEKCPPAAEDCGADIVINSTHKTLASFTQSAVMNVTSERVKTYILEDKLQMIESSSPSYILMASLDINADIIKTHGSRLFDEWQKSIDYFYSEADNISGLKIMKIPGVMDDTKINLDMSSLGIDGAKLEELLMEKGIFTELVTGNILMCMTGIGNTLDDMKKLVTALKEIAAEYDTHADAKYTGTCEDENRLQQNAAAKVWNRKRKLYDISGEKKLVDIDLGIGKICGASIIPYPPGIPLICPGEVIEGEDAAYIKALRVSGQKVIGINDDGKVQILA